MGMPNAFWAQAIWATVDVINMSNQDTDFSQTLAEAWIARMQNGSMCQSNRDMKLEDKATKCFFISYCEQSKVHDV